MLLTTAYRTIDTLIQKCSSTTFLISFVVVVILCFDFFQSLKTGKLIVPEAIYIATITVYGAKSTIKTLWPNGKDPISIYEDAVSTSIENKEINEESQNG